jgi:hypothetical protein
VEKWYKKLFTKKGSTGTISGEVNAG